MFANHVSEWILSRLGPEDQKSKLWLCTSTDYTTTCNANIRKGYVWRGILSGHNYCPTAEGCCSRAEIHCLRADTRGFKWREKRVFLFMSRQVYIYIISFGSSNCIGVSFAAKFILFFLCSLFSYCVQKIARKRQCFLFYNVPNHFYVWMQSYRTIYAQRKKKIENPNAWPRSSRISASQTVCAETWNLGLLPVLCGHESRSALDSRACSKLSQIVLVLLCVVRDEDAHTAVMWIVISKFSTHSLTMSPFGSPFGNPQAQGLWSNPDWPPRPEYALREFWYAACNCAGVCIPEYVGADVIIGKPLLVGPGSLKSSG